MRVGELWSRATSSLSFYRLHLILGFGVPLVSAAILYASNGANHIPYIDALFSSCAPRVRV
jgi:hypothetical protein